MLLTDADRAVLGEAAWTRELSADAAGHLAELCQLDEPGPGERIVSPTEAADRCWLILAGRVKIYQLSAEGAEQILHMYGPGETFGEAAMFAGGRYPAFAEPLEPARLMVLRKGDLLGAFSREPELAMGILAGLSAKLREFNALIEDLALREVPARLARRLLAEADAAGSDRFTLAQSKRELAAQIGTVAETLSRALRTLRDEGLVEVDGAQIRLVDRDGLSDRAVSQ